ncbi:MAG: hypothetical protein ACPGSD_12790 [Flavobacteriales bacterium]
MPKLNNSQVLDSLGINRPGTILAGEFPIYGGTYHFSDSIIDINPDSVINRYKRKDKKGTIWNSNYLNEETVDSLKRNGEPNLIVDYKNDIIVKSIGSTKVYPVYLVNNTNKNLIISKHSTFTHLDRIFYSESLEKWTTFTTADTVSWSWNCGCCFTYYFLKPNHYSIYLFDKLERGQKQKMKIHHFDGFESEPFYGYFDTTSTVKMIRSDGSTGLMDSLLFYKFYQDYLDILIP